jgi:hypothetical protein
VVVKKVLLVGLAALAAFLLAAGRAASDPVWAGQCGIAAHTTVWADYGWPAFLKVMARPGTVLAVTNNPGGDYPAEARALGAATYGFDVHMKDKVGTPGAPADPSTIEAAANKQYQTTVARMGGCATPLIVENELFGAGNVTPWSTTYTEYRSDVLSYLQDLAALGAHPVLLIARSPYLGSSDAVAWWQQVFKVADVVREDYIPAPPVWKLGPVLGNRFLRERYRQAVAGFLSIGIPANRLGIMISVLSAKGGGGRSELQPSASWYQVVKWYSLSAKEVSRELGLGSVFSWGWQEWSAKEVDPDKPKAACVWLWTRDQSLCNAPRTIGPSFETSLTEGQLVLPTGTFCRAPGYGTVGTGEVTRLATVTGDRNAATSALFERIVESRHAGASSRQVLATERMVVNRAFGGSRSAYHDALAQAHATVAMARAALGDEVRRAKLEAALPVRTPTPGEIGAFYKSYPQLLLRRVRVTPKAVWLGGKSEGYALSGYAPDLFFSVPAGRKSRVATLLGPYTVKPAGAAVSLGAVPISVARPAIVAALEGFERAAAFEHWTISLQREALNVATCRADALPQPAEVDLTDYLPFLQLQ